MKHYQVFIALSIFCLVGTISTELVPLEAPRHLHLVENVRILKATLIKPAQMKKPKAKPTLAQTKADLSNQTKQAQAHMMVAQGKIATAVNLKKNAKSDLKQDKAQLKTMKASAATQPKGAILKQKDQILKVKSYIKKKKVEINAEKGKQHTARADLGTIKTSYKKKTGKKMPGMKHAAHAPGYKLRLALKKKKMMTKASKAVGKVLARKAKLKVAEKGGNKVKIEKLQAKVKHSKRKQASMSLKLKNAHQKLAAAKNKKVVKAQAKIAKKDKAKKVVNKQMKKLNKRQGQVIKKIKGKVVNLSTKITKLNPKFRIKACMVQKCASVKPTKKNACRHACIQQYGRLIKTAPMEKNVPKETKNEKKASTVKVGAAVAPPLVGVDGKTEKK